MNKPTLKGSSDLVTLLTSSSTKSLKKRSGRKKPSWNSSTGWFAAKEETK